MSEVDKALAEVIQEVVDSASAASAFVMQELPDVVAQLLTWVLLSSLVWGLVWTAIGIASVVTFRRVAVVRAGGKESYKKYLELSAKGYGNRSFAEDRELAGLRKEQRIAREGKVIGYDYYFSWILSVLLLAIPAAIFSYMEALKVWVAPKLYLIEYAADLVARQT